MIWAREDEVVNDINDNNKNSVFLPDVNLPKQIKATKNINRLKLRDIIVVATPSQHIRKVFNDQFGVEIVFN